MHTLGQFGSRRCVASRNRALSRAVDRFERARCALPVQGWAAWDGMTDGRESSASRPAGVCGSPFGAEAGAQQVVPDVDVAGIGVILLFDDVTGDYALGHGM